MSTPDVEENDDDFLDVEGEEDSEEIESGLVPIKEADQAQRVEQADDRPAIGSWWWLQSKGNKHKATQYDEPGQKWLACVIEIGSNYAKVQGTYFSQRIALDDFHKLCKVEPSPNLYIENKVGFHKTEVRKITGEIQRVCALLGIPMREALKAGEESSTALARVHGTDDIKTHKKALVKAKDKTLPELFEAIKHEHAEMAKWMKADLIPMTAELTHMQGLKNVIASKIHTVELYAGLEEELVQVKKGAPASIDAKLHLMQRRAYMDEECLIRYEAGGMSFGELKDFHKWLSRDENFTRILPHERCIVAFKIRRWSRKFEGGDSLSAFIRFQFETNQDERTLLYIRNGRQLWVLATSIEFGEKLFPSREDHDLIGAHDLWVNGDLIREDDEDVHGVITGREREARILKRKKYRAEVARALQAWKNAGKPTYKEPNWKYVDSDGDEVSISGKPDQFPFGTYTDSTDPDPVKGFEPLTPEHIYFDDVMKKIRQQTNEHNQLAVVIQGLLDRSTCLHPHPPWKLFTPEGFEAGIELVYDVSKALTPGEAPDWENYRKQLHKSVREGAYTIGQRRIWREEFGLSDGYDSRDRWEVYRKHGEGPDQLDQIAQIRGGKALFTWERDRQRIKKTEEWIPSETRPGYGRYKLDDSKIPVNWWCPIDDLFCVDAYTPGDFHIFFDDPRTRADYIKWAPYLLAAEDWHAQRVATESAKKKGKKS